MEKLHTHYDNLKIARNAPPEIIRAAYKALSQKYHPDKNPGKPDASRVMSIINQSYEILSDPIKRVEHDQWIKGKERDFQNSPPPSPPPAPPQNSAAEDQKKEPFRYYTPPPGFNANQSFYGSKFDSTAPANKPYSLLLNLRKYWLIYLIFGIVIFSFLERERDPYKSNHSPPTVPEYSFPGQLSASANRNTSTTTQLSPPPIAQVYARPSKAPNNAMWPTTASYLYGYPVENTGGLSTITIDNSRNSTEAFVKLYFNTGTTQRSVRQAYIPPRGSFTMENVSRGFYDIRYMNLESGTISKSEPFEIREIMEYDGTRFSNFTLTLYQVRNGNMKTEVISPSEF